jgi:hypothetical protein
MDEDRTDWIVGLDRTLQTDHAVPIDARGRKVPKRGLPCGGEGKADMVARIGAHAGKAPATLPVTIGARTVPSSRGSQAGDGFVRNRTQVSIPISANAFCRHIRKSVP